MKLRIVIILFIFFIITTGYSQVSDLQLWGALSVDKKIGQRLKAGIEQELRFDNNISMLSESYTDIGLSYKLSSAFSTGIYYRFKKERNKILNYSTGHRYYIDLSYERRLARLNLKLRSRFQSQYTDIYTSENGFIPKNYNRNKLTIEYRLKNNPYSPSLSAEMFYQLNNPEGNNINKGRYSAGLKRKINNRNSVELFYMLQSEYNRKNPQNISIIGFSYNFDL